MGYAHIDNLYKKPGFLETAGAEVYALEKIHGTSAHITVHFDNTPGPGDTYDIEYHAGGESQVNFEKCFDKATLNAGLCKILGETNIGKTIINGEAYGAKQQG